MKKIIVKIVEAYFEETEYINKKVAYDLAKDIFQACLKNNVKQKKSEKNV